MFTKNWQYYRPKSAFFKEVLELRTLGCTSGLKDIGADRRVSNTAFTITGILVCILLVGVLFPKWQEGNWTVGHYIVQGLLILVFGGIGIFARLRTNKSWKSIGEDLYTLHSYYPRLNLTGPCLPGMIREINEAKRYIGEDLARRTGQIIAKQKYGFRHDAYVEKQELEGRLEFLLRMNLTEKTLSDRFLGQS